MASVFLDPALEAVNLDSVRDQIRISLGSSTVQMEYVDSDKFLESIRGSQPDLAKEVAALGSEKEWVAPKFFSLRGTLSDRIIESLRNIPGVEAVSFSAKRFKPILGNLAAIEWLSKVLFAAILIAMIAVLTLLGRLNAGIFDEAEFIVMQMGGSSLHARFPARLNPVLLSGTAGAVAAILLWKLDPWFTSKMVALSPFLQGMDTAAHLSSVALLGIGLATGIFAFMFAPRVGMQVR